MAGARVERVGSIFRRAEGLYRGSVITKEELPLWYNVYKAFPPKLEPTLKRPIGQQKVTNLIYVEDYVRSHFLKTYVKENRTPINLLTHDTGSEEPVIERYVKCFMEAASKEDGKSSEEIQFFVENQMLHDGIVLKKADQKVSGIRSSSESKLSSAHPLTNETPEVLDSVTTK